MVEPSTDTIKIYVGASPNGIDAESLMVLDWSLKKNTTGPYEVIHMTQNDDPTSVWNNWQTGRWATPFSGYRWAIPWVEEGEQAIYCDSDFIFLADVRELWDEPWQEGKAVMGKGGNQGWRYCCAKWNVHEARKHLIPLERLKGIPESHQRMMAMFAHTPAIVQPFNGNWNCIDGEGLNPGEMDEADPAMNESFWRSNVKALHYSDMSSQLHVKYAFPRLEKEAPKIVNGKEANHWFDGGLYEHPNQSLCRLFDQYYEEALADGMKVEDYLVPENKWVEIVKEPQTGYGVTFKAHAHSGGA